MAKLAKYGKHHERKRTAMAAELEQVGAVRCARSSCGLEVMAWWYYVDKVGVRGEAIGHVRSCKGDKGGCEGQCWTTWDLGHADDGSTGGWEHRCCNRSAGGRNGARAVAARKREIDREW